jgi:hypothetical protein
MPYTYTIDSGRRLAIATGEGICDLASALATLRRLVADPSFGPDFRVLVDLRAAEYTPSAGEVRALAQFYASPGGLGGHRLARVVSRLVDYGVGNMLATLASLGGGTVSTFLSVEEALAWLDAPGD